MWSAGLAFIPCELGERLTAAFIGISDDISNLDWHAYPIGMQKALPLVIINAQELITLECFGEISCTRGVFKSVSKYKSMTHSLILIIICMFGIHLDHQQCFFVLYVASPYGCIKSRIGTNISFPDDCFKFHMNKNSFSNCYLIAVY